MSAKSNLLENDLLKLIFNGTTIPELAENDTTSPATTLTVALHTADPGEAGDQSTSEIVYTGYARVAVNRDGTGWTVTGNSVSPFADIEFGEMTAGAGGVVTHVSIGTGTSNRMLYKGALTPNINVVNGVIPRIKTTSTLTEE